MGQRNQLTTWPTLASVTWLALTVLFLSGCDRGEGSPSGEGTRVVPSPAPSVMTGDTTRMLSADTAETVAVREEPDQGPGKGEQGGVVGPGDGTTGCGPAGTPDPGLEGELTTNPRRTWNYVQGLCWMRGYSEGKYWHDIKEVPQCVTGTCPPPVRMIVRPHADVELLDHNQILADGRGRVVARYANIDGRGRTFRPWRLGRQGFVYLWLGKEGNQIKPQMFRLVSRDSVELLPMPADAGFVFAENGDAPHVHAKARWEPPHDHPNIRSSHNSTWVSCAGGCCTATSLFAFADAP